MHYMCNTNAIIAIYNLQRLQCFAILGRMNENGPVRKMLVALREKADLTQAQLAEKLSVYAKSVIPAGSGTN